MAHVIPVAWKCPCWHIAFPWLHAYGLACETWSLAYCVEIIEEIEDPMPRPTIIALQLVGTSRMFSYGLFPEQPFWIFKASRHAE